MSNYIITGGTSFIGKAIVKELISKGHQVYVVIRPSSTQKKYFDQFENCHVILTDIDNLYTVISAIPTCVAFLHLGWDGVGSAGRADINIQKHNIQMSLKCIEIAAKLKCKAFLFAGSQAEYGITNQRISEETICNPVIEYGKAKLEVFQKGLLWAAQYGLTYYHARIFSVYGAEDHPWTLISSCIHKFLNGDQMLTSSGEQLWNFMYVKDAAQVICQLLNSGARSGIYNIASTDTRQLKDFIYDIYELCGKQGEIVFGAYDPAEKSHGINPDISKLMSSIGPIHETSFRDGIKETIRLLYKRNET